MCQIRRCVITPLFALAFAACAYRAGSMSATSDPARAAGADQVARGQKLYGERCAGCHGAGGEGIAGKGPAVVGHTALPLDPPAGAKARNAQFRTAADVFGWVKANMPAGKGGSLTDEEYAAVLAFDLKANGVDLGGKTLDPALAASLVLNR